MSYESVLASDLHNMGEARRYRRWMYRRMEPYLGRRILEVGAGTGNFTELLLDRDLLVATDVHTSFLRVLEHRFPGAFAIPPFLWDIAEPAPGGLPHGMVDTVVCINVLEHVADDRAALRNLGEVLPCGGTLVLLVPALGWLYGSVDEALGHYRRYGKRELASRLSESGFEVRRLFYMNTVGVPGWLLNGKVLRHTESSQTQVRIFDRFFVPWVEPLERILPPPFGLSLIAVGRRLGRDPMMRASDHRGDGT